MSVRSCKFKELRNFVAVFNLHNKSRKPLTSFKQWGDMIWFALYRKSMALHFRFYRGTGADFLNLSRVDIWTRQVFVGEGTCTLQGVSQRPRPLSTGCSSHLSLSRDNQKCAQTLLERYPLGNQFLVEKHWAGVNAGFPLSSGREILLTGLEWWRWSLDEQMG